MVEQYTAIFVWFLSALSWHSAAMFCSYYRLGIKYCSSFCSFFFPYTTGIQVGCPGAFKWSQSMGHTSSYTFQIRLTSHSHHSGITFPSQCSTEALKNNSRDRQSGSTSGFIQLEESSSLLTSAYDHVVPFHQVLGCRWYSILSSLEIGVANWIICLLLTSNESSA